MQSSLVRRGHFLREDFLKLGSSILYVPPEATCGVFARVWIKPRFLDKQGSGPTFAQ